MDRKLSTSFSNRRFCIFFPFVVNKVSRPGYRHIQKSITSSHFDTRSDLPTVPTIPPMTFKILLIFCLLQITLPSFSAAPKYMSLAPNYVALGWNVFYSDMCSLFLESSTCFARHQPGSYASHLDYQVIIPTIHPQQLKYQELIPCKLPHRLFIRPDTPTIEYAEFINVIGYDGESLEVLENWDTALGTRSAVNISQPQQRRVKCRILKRRSRCLVLRSISWDWLEYQLGSTWWISLHQ